MFLASFFSSFYLFPPCSLSLPPPYHLLIVVLQDLKDQSQSPKFLFTSVTLSVVVVFIVREEYEIQKARHYICGLGLETQHAGRGRSTKRKKITRQYTCTEGRKLQTHTNLFSPSPPCSRSTTNKPSQGHNTWKNRAGPLVKGSQHEYLPIHRPTDLFPQSLIPFSGSDFLLFFSSTLWGPGFLRSD